MLQLALASFLVCAVLSLSGCVSVVSHPSLEGNVARVCPQVASQSEPPTAPAPTPNYELSALELPEQESGY